MKSYPMILHDVRTNSNRFTLFPITYHNLWDMHKQAESLVWTANEVLLDKDISDFQKLPDNEKEFISKILAFFAASDGIVNFNISARFAQQIEVPEINAFYAFQSYIETVHSETYSLLIDTLIKDPHKKELYFNAIDNIPSIKKKADFALKYMEHGTFEECLIAFALVEGMFFSSSFCGIFFMKSKNRGMPGLTQTNFYISRDEMCHAQFACEVYKTFVNNGTLTKIPEERMFEIMKEAMECEISFCNECLQIDLVGMKSSDMIQYVKLVADRLLVQLGYSKLYNASNPFDWMNMIGMDCKTNFFEAKVTAYSIPTETARFALDEEF